jgi:hypothetical protein
MVRPLPPFFINSLTLPQVCLSQYVHSLPSPSSLPKSHLRTAITTVGYGEITPRSFLGRLVTVPLLVFGLLLIALPSFVLGREFSAVWERMARDHVRLFSFLSFLSFSPVSFLSSFLFLLSVN